MSDFTNSPVLSLLPPGPVVRSMLSLLLILNCLLVGNIILPCAFGLAQYHLLEDTYAASMKRYSSSDGREGIEK